MFANVGVLKSENYSGKKSVCGKHANCNATLVTGCRGAAELLRQFGAVLSPGAANALLYEAAAAGNSRCLELLLLDAAGRPRANPWASPNARPFKSWDGRLAHGGTALDASEVKQHSLCTSLLRRAGGRHSMQRAAELALPEMLQQWLQEGADIEERDSSGATPLWLAAKGTKCPASELQRSECIELLLAARATVDALPITQETPLMVAAQRGSVPHCQLLLQAQADVLRQDRRGKRVVQHAANGAVRQLLQREAAVQGEANSAGPEGFNPGPVLSPAHMVPMMQGQEGRSCRSFETWSAHERPQETWPSEDWRSAAPCGYAPMAGTRELVAVRPACQLSTSRLA
eukprot:s1814_g9.t1